MATFNVNSGTDTLTFTFDSVETATAVQDQAATHSAKSSSGWFNWGLPLIFLDAAPSPAPSNENPDGLTQLNGANIVGIGFNNNSGSGLSTFTSVRDGATITVTFANTDWDAGGTPWEFFDNLSDYGEISGITTTFTHAYWVGTDEEFGTEYTYTEITVPAANESAAPEPGVPDAHAESHRGRSSSFTTGRASASKAGLNNWIRPNSQKALKPVTRSRRR